MKIHLEYNVHTCIKWTVLCTVDVWVVLQYYLGLLASFCCLFITCELNYLN